MRSLVPSRSTLGVPVTLSGVATFVLFAMFLWGRSASSASATTTPPAHAALAELLRELQQATPAPPPTLADSLAADLSAALEGAG